MAALRRQYEEHSAEDKIKVAQHREATLETLSSSVQKRPGPLAIQGPSTTRIRRSFRFSSQHLKVPFQKPNQNSSSAPPSAFKPFITFDFENERHQYDFQRALLRGQSSRSSRVSWDFFDPQGVQNLRRTLIRSSAQATVDLPGLGRHSMSSDSHYSCSSDNNAAQGLAGAEKKNDFDFEAVLKEIVQKCDEQHIAGRSLGILFKDLTVTGVSSRSSYDRTLGSIVNPLYLPNLISEIRHPDTKSILYGFDGVVKPGEMLLVLGRPGAGCSTFLKTLANQTDEYFKVAGQRHYDSFTPEEIFKCFRGDVTYCAEEDIHFPSLTVSQTIEFAAKTRAPAVRVNNLSRSEFVKQTAEILMTIFGLRHARDTRVGDAILRGVSGGEKKRVSIAEALASRSLLGCWDNSTRGLDASTALEFGKALRIATDMARLTTVVAIYQASENLYQLFDKVCVIGEGRMFYFGASQDARKYFEGLGYHADSRQTTADFLVTITDPRSRKVNTAHIGPVPRTPDEFARAFQVSRAGRASSAEMMEYWHAFVGRAQLATAYSDSARAERAKFTRSESSYTTSVTIQLRAALLRRVQILRGDMGTQLIQLFAFLFQATVIGTEYLKVPNNTSAFFSRGGVIYFTMLFGAISSMAEIPALYAQRPIVQRQYRAAMYHPFIDALALTVVDAPVAFAIQLLFSVMVYFIVGLQRSASQFLTFLLMVYVTTLTMKGFYRAVAAAFKKESSAQALAGIMTLIFILYTGYAIPKPSMVRALRWITNISPLRYSFEAILTNEFSTLNAQCVSLVPSGPGYENVPLKNQVCTTVGSISGQSVVSGNRFVELAYGFSHSNLWRDCGIVAAFGIGFNLILLLLTEINTATAKENAPVRWKRSQRARSDRCGSTSSQESRQRSRQGYTQKEILTWRNLKYVVRAGREEHTLLDSVSGFVAPGKLTALMGESGAGKTTLLNCLAGRSEVGVVTGDVLVSGRRLPANFKSSTGYCQQQDIHSPQQTVREALLFSASLRQPEHVSLVEKEAFVDECLIKCGLEEYADAIVSTLNVEYKKRTTIGVELAARPKLLIFLDEPTSGLDSQSALAIMAFLRKLADEGQAILCTVHQPSNQLFQYFDYLLLLQKGGKTVYFGEVGDQGRTLITYFERNGARSCGTAENPAEWMLEVIGAGASATSKINWSDLWKASAESAQLQQEIANFHIKALKATQTTSVEKEQVNLKYVTSWKHQFWTLLLRAYKAYWRSPAYLSSKLVLNAATGLFTGLTFYHAKDSIQGTQNKLFAIFVATVVCVPIANQLQIPFIEARRIFEARESQNQMYSWSAFVTSQLFLEIPWNIAGSALLFLTWYWTVGFQSDRAAYTFLVLVILFPVYYTSLAQAIAAMSANSVISTSVFNLLFSFVGTFDGVLQPYSQLGWWRWMYRTSPFTYLIEALLGQALGKQDINCSPTEYVTLDPYNGTCINYLGTYISNYGGYLVNPNATSQCRYCPARTTDQYLQNNFNISYGNKWRDVGILFAFAIFNIFSVYAFTYIFRVQKKSLFGH